MSLFISVDVPKYCKANPREIIPDHDNCAHYFDCVKVNQNRTSRAMTTGMVSECKYPDLFDSQTLTCQSFTSVSCHDRPEPQAPCKFSVLYVFFYLEWGGGMHLYLYTIILHNIIYAYFFLSEG